MATSLVSFKRTFIGHNIRHTGDREIERLRFKKNKGTFDLRHILEAIIRESQKHGYSNYWVAGVPAGRIHPLKDMSQVKGSFVFFESESLDFPVTGVSDVMSYKSSLKTY